MNTRPLVQHRLFYALWPDAVAAHKLQGLQEVLSGKKTHIKDFHLTLAFLGEQSDEALPVLKAILLALSLSELTCVVDAYGCFSRLKLVWAGMTTPPQGLFELRRDLLERLRKNCISFPQEAAFRPHITLARKVDNVPQGPIVPISCSSLSLVLAQSVDVSSGGPRYRVLASRQLSLQQGSHS